MVKNIVRRIIKTSSFIIMPLLFGLSAIANTLISILLTDKWIACVPYLRAVCIQQTFSILNTVNMQAIKAIGKSETILKLESLKKPIYLIIILAMMFISPLAICIGNAVYAGVALFINVKPNKKYLDYGLKEQVSDVFIYFIISLIMEIIVIAISYININKYLLLIAQIIVGIVFYVGISKILKLDSYEYVNNIIKDFIHSKKSKKNNN